LVVSLFLAIFGYLMGYFIAGIYNIFTARLGGLKVEIGPEKEAEKNNGPEEKKEEAVEQKVAEEKIEEN
jgi:hypothetical protein